VKASRFSSISIRFSSTGSRLTRVKPFCTVEIAEVLNRAEAWEQGYREPTHYRDNPDFDIYGKHTGSQSPGRSRPTLP